MTWLTVPAGAVSAAVADLNIVRFGLICNPDRHSRNQVSFHRRTLLARYLMKVDEPSAFTSSADHVALS
jgi:hypothetical protein